MQKLEPTVATTTLSYHGHQVHKILAAHKDVVNAIGYYCSELVDATIKVHTEEGIESAWPLAWNLDISSPAGRMSMTVSQRAEGTKVSFTHQ